MAKTRAPIVHGTVAGRGGHRSIGEPPCELCRTAWAAACRRWGAEARARGWKRPTRTTKSCTCQHCGSEFTAEQAQPFCSHRCHMRERYKKSAELALYVPPPAPPHRLGYVPVRDLTPRKQRRWCSGPCSWCGQHFTIVDQMTARWCSKRCVRAASRADRSDRFRVSPLVRAAIYERDGWICRLCSEPIDRQAHYLSDWAPSLDHVECQSWALIPNHSPTNLRTAHRWCNSVRGDGTYHLNFFKEAS